MTKYILAAIAALGLVIAPAAAMAQDSGKSGDEGGKMKMKGPPNADGYKGDKNAGGDGKDADGAAAAKATGEDKK